MMTKYHILKILKKYSPKMNKSNNGEKRSYDTYATNNLLGPSLCTAFDYRN